MITRSQRSVDPGKFDGDKSKQPVYLLGGRADFELGVLRAQKAQEM